MTPLPGPTTPHPQLFQSSGHRSDDGESRGRTPKEPVGQPVQVQTRGGGAPVASGRGSGGLSQVVTNGPPRAASGQRDTPTSKGHTSSSSMRRRVSLMNLMYWLVSVVSSL